APAGFRAGAAGTRTAASSNIALGTCSSTSTAACSSTAAGTLLAGLITGTGVASPVLLVLLRAGVLERVLLRRAQFLVELAERLVDALLGVVAQLDELLALPL